MATQQNKQTIIDSHFFVPQGAVDIRQENLADTEFNYNSGVVATDGNAPIISTPTSTVPMPPTSFTIVSQHVRISTDGTTVVDVTLQFPDIPGINSIDVRITKDSSV